MPTYRYPVVLCRDAAGGWSALAIDYEAVGFGATAADARQDLREFLIRMHDKNRASAGPDFCDAVLSWHAITVRPEYRHRDRTFACATALTAKVLCVSGARASGQPAAELPLLGVRFDYAKVDDHADLVCRFALQKLEGLTPEQLSRYLPPDETKLIELAIRTPHDATTRTESKAPPNLARVAEALGDRAVRKGFARAWCRDVELAGLVHKLHAEKTSVLLVGEPGVGKTTLLADAVRAAEKLANADDDEDETRWRHPRRFWLTSAARLVAGMKYLGQWEERVEEVIAELGAIRGVLCVDKLLDLARRGGFGPADSIAAFLAPFLARGEVRLVAEATPAELDACRRLLPGLADLFQIVNVRPFDRREALLVIDRQLEAAASGAGVEIQSGAGERIVRLFRRFMPYAPFPGPASTFARELVVTLTRLGRKQLNPEDVVERFRRRTGLPELFLRDELALAHADVSDWFGARVIDQPAACAAATAVVLALKAGLNDPDRPPAVLLFCGPTGVGKTHMAQALAGYLFGHGDDTAKKPGESPRLIRLDMSEFGGFDAVHRLLGPPDGEPAELIRRVRREPFSVLLLDEIEKAAPEVFDTLMGVFDEGRLTDQYGRVTNFRSTVIVMTSNLGASRTGAIGFGDDPGPRYGAMAARFFRPEFFNRMDAVVTFNPLTSESVRAIARRELAAVAHRDGLTRAGLQVVWSEAVIERIVAIGFDARYGARPMQRAIERRVVAPLAQWLLANPIHSGLIYADWVVDHVQFTSHRIG